MVRILFLCEDIRAEKRAAAFRGAMSTHGVEVAHVPFNVHLPKWMRFLRQADLVVVLYYGMPSNRLRLTLAIAHLMQRPIVRWWVGSDVFDCLEDSRIREASRALDRIISANITVADHLTDELRTCGIVAQTILSSLSVPYEAPQSSVPFDVTRSRAVLLYFPRRRFEFYKGETILRIIGDNPDLRFVVVGKIAVDPFAGLQNVDYLGWVGDMAGVYPKIGLVLRLTQHDGMPRMLLEALMRGKYVIYSWPLPGCWLAKTYEEVSEKLALFREVNTINFSGLSAVRQLFDPDPASKWSQLIHSEIAKGTPRNRGMGTKVAYQATLDYVGQRLKLVMR